MASPDFSHTDKCNAITPRHDVAKIEKPWGSLQVNVTNDTTDMTLSNVVSVEVEVVA